MFTLMGNLYRYAKQRASSERALALVLVGLDNAGKTTLLAALRGETAPPSTTPTWGFNTEKMVSGAASIALYDLGGGRKIRGIWGKYYAEVHGIIFVVDAADSERFEEAKEALHEAVKDALSAGKPLLIFCNKQDLPTAASAPDMAKALDLPSLPNLRHHIVACYAKPPNPADAPDPRIKEGLKWLLNCIDADWAKLKARVDHDSAAQAAEEERKKLERRKRVEAAKAERKRLAEEEAAREAAEAAENALRPPAPAESTTTSTSDANAATPAPPLEPNGIRSAPSISLDAEKPAPPSLLVDASSTGATQSEPIEESGGARHIPGVIDSPPAKSPPANPLFAN
mmetsp:Transcript_22895/g.74586  ORF Transcript_22895/g.74586 Transcript_22895/m.74586 type:complete len:342 (+) Transcript_22895:176-1201(+)